MLLKYRKFNQLIVNIYLTIAMVCIIGITIASSVQVSSRYILNFSQSWTEELSRFLFIWFNLTGASVVFNKGNHAAIDFLSKRMKGRSKIIHELFVYTVVISISMILIIYGIQIMIVSSRQNSPAMGISMAWMYLAVPIGGVGIILTMIEKIINLLLKENKYISEL